MKFHSPKSLTVLRAVTGGIWLLCTVLLLAPKPWILFWKSQISEEISIEFSVSHLCMFGTLGFFVELSRRQWDSLTWLHILVAYGLATEILQHFIPSRTCSVLDLCQDCAGAYLGIHLGLIVKKIYGRFANSSIHR